jgi:DNA-binding NarL/FixJ family response regulator
MATGLGLSIKTVESHRSQIMKRLQIFDVAGLVLHAVREGVISLDD